MNRIFLFFIFFTLTALRLDAQGAADSLRRILLAGPDDSAKVQLLIAAGQEYEAAQPEAAKQFYLSAGKLSQKINYPQGVIQYVINYTAVLNTQGAYDSSVRLNLHGLQLARKIKDTLLTGKSLFNTGIAYRGTGDYTQAIRYCLEGEQIFEHLGNSRIQAQCDNILQVLYTDQGELQRAAVYGEKAVKRFRGLGIPDLLSEALINLAIVYKGQGNTGKAAPLLQEALRITTESGNVNMRSTALLNLGDMYLEQNEYRQARPYMEAALPLFAQVGSVEGQAIALRGVAICLFQEKKFAEAKRYAEQALNLTMQEGLRVQQSKNLLFLSDVAIAQHDLVSYDRYRRAADRLADTLMNDRVQEQMLNLEQKYETEKKEQSIRQLTQEKKIQALSLRQKSTLNTILVLVILAVAAISLLVYRNYHQHKKLQARRIRELETEKQLLATEALLEGEEKERSRLAKELHDGLGGMLSGIRHGFQRLAQDISMEADDKRAFAQTIDMLDASVRELRNVAHNLTPENLYRFGLNTALEDFCSGITQTGALQIAYQSFGLDREPAPLIAVTIYRIVQELAGNILKHAAAGTAIVQLSCMEGKIAITVEDDGKGMDKDMLPEAKGIGWNNIRSRVEYLRGTLDIRSAPGEGVSVHIELPYEH